MLERVHYWNVPVQCTATIRTPKLPLNPTTKPNCNSFRFYRFLHFLIGYHDVFVSNLTNITNFVFHLKTHEMSNHIHKYLVYFLFITLANFDTRPVLPDIIL